jgi:hypothetical protein
MSVRVSVVTVYFNRRDCVEQSIGSLLAQSLRDVEIIVVDDGSTDGTREALRAIRHPAIRLLELQNGGFTEAIRAGIAAAEAPFIAVHGSGDISLPERLDRQAAILDERPDVAVVGCHVKNAMPGGRYERFAPPNGLDFSEALLRRNLFTHGEVMFRKDAYDRCGGYRPFFRFAQDIDLWLRMSALGGYHIVEEMLYERERRGDGVGASPEKFLLQQKFAEFARQCRESVLRGEGDLLDRHGPAAPLLMRRSRRLAQVLGTAGASQMVNGSPASGWRLVQAALEEHWDLRLAAMSALLASHRQPLLFHKIVVPMIKRLRGT